MAESDDVLIRLARVEDVSLLAPIEAAGDAMFAAVGHAEFIGQDTISSDEALDHIRNNSLFVAEVADRVVGFAVLGWCGGERQLHQISVHPHMGREGIGSRLLADLITSVRAAGEPSIVLDTQADVAWNRPWYERFGFAVVPESEWTPAMREITAEQTEEGLNWASRVHMRLSFPVSE